jgi:hypothetical protein
MLTQAIYPPEIQQYPRLHLVCITNTTPQIDSMYQSLGDRCHASKLHTKINAPVERPATFTLERPTGKGTSRLLWLLVLCLEWDKFLLTRGRGSMIVA